MTAYYNEFDPYAAQWLRNLSDAGLIAKGEVDERSIEIVQSGDLKGFTQCHFFAGIGGWSLAARLAGWPDDRPLWTGSAPCQPFSTAGNRKGRSDERHLWPKFFSLIRACQPPTIMGEQVSDAIGEGWLDEVFGDLELEGYSTGAIVLPASAFEADHERERLYWIADTECAGWERYKQNESLSCRDLAAYAISGDPFADARSFLDGNKPVLLLDDGLPVGVEREAAKGYGNAIVPQVAAEIIKAYMECKP